jgi:hypothetical protein
MNGPIETPLFDFGGTSMLTAGVEGALPTRFIAPTGWMWRATLQRLHSTRRMIRSSEAHRLRPISQGQSTH